MCQNKIGVLEHQRILEVEHVSQLKGGLIEEQCARMLQNKIIAIEWCKNLDVQHVGQFKGM